MPLTQTISQKLQGVADGSGRDGLFLKQFMGGQRILWTSLLGVDRTTVPTRIEIGALEGANFYLLNSAAPPAANQSVGAGGILALPGSFRVGCIIIGAVLGDVLEFYAYGMVIPVGGFFN
jgi:hypothetical protein